MQASKITQWLDPLCFNHSFEANQEKLPSWGKCQPNVFCVYVYIFKFSLVKEHNHPVITSCDQEPSILTPAG